MQNESVNTVDYAGFTVLSVKPTSQDNHLKVISGGIDKLNGYFTEPVSKDIILASARVIGASVRKVFLKDKKPYLEITRQNEVIHLKLGFGENDVTCYITNPNKFQSWRKYTSFLCFLVPQEAINTSKISRVDLNLDFACGFTDLISAIDIKHKRSSLTYIDNSGTRTGMIVGKGSETIAIYDKAKKENINDLLARIEIRLSGTKLPTRSLEDLPFSISNSNYFDQVAGIDIVESGSFLKSDEKSKLENFKLLSHRDGFYATKKSLNQNRNFERDYRNLFQITEWAIQPKELFKEEISKFFNQEEEARWSQ